MERGELPTLKHNRRGQNLRHGEERHPCHELHRLERTVPLREHASGCYGQRRTNHEECRDDLHRCVRFDNSQGDATEREDDTEDDPRRGPLAKERPSEDQREWCPKLNGNSRYARGSTREPDEDQSEVQTAHEYRDDDNLPEFTFS